MLTDTFKFTLDKYLSRDGGGGSPGPILVEELLIIDVSWQRECLLFWEASQKRPPRIQSVAWHLCP